MGALASIGLLHPLRDPELVKTARLIGLLGLAWASLEVLAYILIRPFFLSLLDRNPKLKGNAKKQATTAVQMLPRVVCFVHNIIQIPLALSILLDPYYNKDRIWAKDDFSSLVMSVSAGYFLYDTLECLIRIKHEGVDFLIHGVFCFVVFTNLTYTGYFHFYGAGFLLWELSTPFIHFRWVLYKLGKESSKLYSFNALAGMLVFFLCRIVWGNMCSLMFWVDSVRALRTPEGAMLPMSSIWFYRLCTVVMNGLNAWWFSKMVKILLAAIRIKSQAAAGKGQ